MIRHYLSKMSRSIFNVCMKHGVVIHISVLALYDQSMESGYFKKILDYLSFLIVVDKGDHDREMSAGLKKANV